MRSATPGIRRPHSFEDADVAARSGACGFAGNIVNKDAKVEAADFIKEMREAHEARDAEQ